MSGTKLFVAVIVVASTVFVAGCSSDKAGKAAGAETVRGVPVVVLQPADMPDLLEAAGTVRAAQTSQLASQVMGTLMEVRVREGDRIRRGQVLAIVDDAQARAAVDRAAAAAGAAQQEIVATESELALSEATLKRYQSLYEKKSVSPQEFDEVRTREQAALARRDMARAGQAQASALLAQARTALDYTRIRAPFDGVVVERRLDPGAMAAPGTPILVVEDPSRYRLEASVNESDLRYVRLGQSAPVLVDALNAAALSGKVAQIVPAADPASRSFVVKVELPRDARLRSGLFGRAQFSRGVRNSLTVPQTAVIARGQLQGVYALDQNQVAGLRYVTLGRSSGGQVEVLAGLQAGERLVAKPGEMELSGKRIEAAQ